MYNEEGVADFKLFRYLRKHSFKCLMYFFDSLLRKGSKGHSESECGRKICWGNGNPTRPHWTSVEVSAFLIMFTVKDKTWSNLLKTVYPKKEKFVSVCFLYLALSFSKRTPLKLGSCQGRHPFWPKNTCGSHVCYFFFLPRFDVSLLSSITERTQGKMESTRLQELQLFKCRGAEVARS